LEGIYTMGMINFQSNRVKMDCLSLKFRYDPYQDKAETVYIQRTLGKGCFVT
jgi:hypothetical protein